MTLPSKPFAEATVTVKVADPPTLTVALVGETEGRKSQTCNVAETEWLRGLLTPVIVNG
ncbi:MAG: hypothetical protein WBY96_03195 [Candidatus Sulfotelmatobacter sp.]